MLCFPYTDIPDQPVDMEGVQGVTVRWLLADDHGARNFHMRRFTVAPGGQTPRHAHGFEHEVYVLEGKGELWDGPAGEWRALKPGDVVADIVGVFGAFLTSTGVLGMDGWVFYSHVVQQIRPNDLFTGLAMAGAFGLEISLIACHEGLNVRGGAAGVGRATTMTVVYSIVSLIVTACVFTIVFFLFRI